MRLIPFTISLLMALGFVASVSNVQAAGRSACENSTVADAWGPQFASEANSFLATLQRVIRSNDKRKFATLVRYPVDVFTGNDKEEIRTAADLIRRYTSIVTPDLKRSILSQSPDCLFANGQGVMIGGGRIWFQKQSNGEMKIITFNVFSSEGK